jgi:hypothetical protein
MDMFEEEFAKHLFGNDPFKKNIINSIIFGKKKNSNDDDNQNKRSIDNNNRNIKKSRTKRRIRNYSDTTWWRIYIIDEDCSYRDPKHPNGKLFVQRFGLDHVEVQQVVRTLETRKESPWYQRKKQKDSKYLFLLVLGSLRILTRNWTFDDVEEATDISRQVIEVFFSKFVKFYAEIILPEVVSMPEPDNEEAFKLNSKEYFDAQVPNAIGSMDAVHVRLWNCASNLKQACTGKEKYPSRAYNIVVNHRKKVLSAQKGFYGSTNDKSIVWFDNAALSLRAGMYNNMECKIKSKSGEDLVLKG